jgi:hypothetical protein
MRHKDESNFECFINVLCFELFVNIFVLKREQNGKVKSVIKQRLFLLTSSGKSYPWKKAGKWSPHSFPRKKKKKKNYSSLAA